MTTPKLQLVILAILIPAAAAQSLTAAISGKLLDAKISKPVSAAWVIATRAGAPSTVTRAAGQSVAGVSPELVPASVLTITVSNPLQSLAQKTSDGRTPGLALGVWGPKGLYHPAHSSGKLGAIAGPSAAAASYSHRLAIPLDTALNFYIASHGLQLADSTGVAQPGNASRQSFQHATGVPTRRASPSPCSGCCPAIDKKVPGGNAE